MSAHPTVSETYSAISDELHEDFDFERGVQSLLNRAYASGIAPEANVEITVDLSEDSTDTTTDSDDRRFFLLDHETYMALVSARQTTGGSGFKVADLSATQVRPAVMADHFIDYGRTTVDGSDFKKYLIPTGLLGATTCYALVRRKAPDITSEQGNPQTNENLIPLYSIDAVRLGLQAIGYEQQGDTNTSKDYWSRFAGELSMMTTNSEGRKDFAIGVNHPFLTKPENFM